MNNNNLPAVNSVTQAKEVDISAMEKAIAMNDLAGLTQQQRMSYYKAVCDSVGLNPLTKPFEYITFEGKLQLYACKNCAEQLRDLHNISAKIISREVVDTLLVVTCRATKGKREDESIGVIDFTHLKGKEKANAMMKAETKAKRRVTLSICGLGMLDESEMQDIDVTPESDTKALSDALLRPKIKKAPELEATPQPEKPAKKEKPFTERLARMAELFEVHHVSLGQLEKWKGGPIESFDESDLDALRIVYGELESGVAPETYFGAEVA